MTSNFDVSEVLKIFDISEGLRVFLVDRLDRQKEFGAFECARNIFLMDSQDNVVWQVSYDFDSDGGAFTNVFCTEGRIQGYRWDGGVYEIDVITGVATPEGFLK